MLAHRLQYHRFRPYWTMLFFPVLTSMLGVLWHLEHLAKSNDEAVLLLSDELESSECMFSSLVTWSTFCTGTGRGLLGDP